MIRTLSQQGADGRIRFGIGLGIGFQSRTRLPGRGMDQVVGYFAEQARLVAAVPGIGDRAELLEDQRSLLLGLGQAAQPDRQATAPGRT